MAGEEGVRIGGECINNIRYADDTVLLAEIESDLLKLVKAVENTCKTHGISIIPKKTELLLISKAPHSSNIVIYNSRLEQVYLHNIFKILRTAYFG